MRVFILVMIFFVLSGLLIISNNNLSIHSVNNFGRFGDFYLGWINQVYSNLQGVTGEVIKMNWFPINQTNNKI